ncbi:MAG: hypothetical protein ABIG64_01040 [Candidatus Omnitrophota bacterium]
MMLHKYYIIPFLISLFIVLGITPFILKITLMRKIVDKPAKRKIHRQPVPTLGGMGIWLGFNVGIGAVFFMIPELKVNFLHSFLGISLCTAIIVFMGYYGRHF